MANILPENVIPYDNTMPGRRLQQKGIWQFVQEFVKIFFLGRRKCLLTYIGPLCKMYMKGEIRTSDWCVFHTTHENNILFCIHRQKLPLEIFKNLEEEHK